LSRDAYSIALKTAMWEAVFADVGVALLAILNAVRIPQMRF
jgi:Cd2+/Zn2+-exporting ATPase